MQLRSGRVVPPPLPQLPPSIEDKKPDSTKDDDDDDQRIKCSYCYRRDPEGFVECPLCRKEGKSYCKQCFYHHQNHCTYQKGLQNEPCDESDCDMTDDEDLSDMESDDDPLLAMMKQAQQQVKEMIRGWSL